MNDTSRRTIFVPLRSSKTGKNSVPNCTSTESCATTALVDSKIWLVPGDSFKVCDGNGFDLAYGCADTYDGNPFDGVWNGTYYNDAGEAVPLVEAKIGAVFQLPCNNNLDEMYWDSNGDGIRDTQLDQMVGCNQAVDVEGNVVPWDEELHGMEVPTANYEIWARSLGKPGGSAVTSTCATVNGEIYCSLENVVMSRSKGKSTFANVTNEMSSLVVGYCDGTLVDAGSIYTCDDGDDMTTDDLTDGDVTWTRIALFAGNTEDWFWNYDNNGLRLAQLRFYTID